MQRYDCLLASEGSGKMGGEKGTEMFYRMKFNEFDKWFTWGCTVTCHDITKGQSETRGKIETRPTTRRTGSTTCTCVWFVTVCERFTRTRTTQLIGALL